jgi:hypothetical protein
MAVRADSTTAPIAQQTLPKKNRMLDGKPSCGCAPAILHLEPREAEHWRRKAHAAHRANQGAPMTLWIMLVAVAANDLLAWLCANAVRRP